jgi:ArsR family transcriptional regulator, lead/cadmium/zinc/bismuth-responsive transcriptional repressor
MKSRNGKPAPNAKAPCAHTHALVLSLPPDPDALERAAGLFRAMGDTARLRMLHLLARGEICVGELVTALSEKFSTVSQRLRVLRSEGLVRRRRDGSHVYYALADDHVKDLVANALAHASEPEETQSEDDE